MVKKKVKAPVVPIKKVRSLTDVQIDRLKHHLQMPRYVFKQNLSEYICCSDEQTPLTCVSTEISKFGISLVTRTQLIPDMTFHLKLPKHEKSYKLFVVWCEPNQFKPEIFHSGLELSEHKENLMLEFVKAGLLKQKQASPDQDRKPIDFYAIQESLSKLHAQDKSLLAKVGYKSLVHTHTSYSTRVANQSIVVVMPSNMDPKNLMDLDAYEASKQIFIVVEESVGFAQKQWVKVWPGYGLLSERISAELRKPKPQQNLGVSPSSGHDPSASCDDDDLDEEFEVEVS